MGIAQMVKTVIKGASKHSPELLTGLGICGFAGCVVMTAKAAPYASMEHAKFSYERDLIRDDCETKRISEEEAKDAIRDSVKEEAIVMAKLYGPAAVMGLGAIGCVLFSNRIHISRKAALLTAYSLSEKKLSAYQQKAIELVGQEKHEQILEGATKELARMAPVDEEDHLLMSPTPEGSVRCYDVVTGRYFFASKEKIMEAESAINKRLLNEVRVPLQEFYYELGLEERFFVGESVGWDISSHYTMGDNMLNIWFTPMLDDDKNPCLAINYHVTVFDRTI